MYKIVQIVINVHGQKFNGRQYLSRWYNAMDSEWGMSHSSLFVINLGIKSQF